MESTNLKSTILACDDVAAHIKLLKLVVKDMGWKIVIAASKAKAIARLSKIRPAVVTTDLTPDHEPDGADAFDLIRAIRAYDVRITVIVISGGLNTAQARKARRLADLCLRKPFDPLMLRKAIEKGLAVIGRPRSN